MDEHLAVFAVLTDTRSERDGAGQRGPTADRMHHRRAGEIEHAELRQPTSAPDPMAGNRVNKAYHQKAKNIESAELNSLGNRPGNNRGRGSGENQLEEKLCPQRNASPVDRGVNAFVSISHRRTVISPF
jgi:hypothetical protein